ncbi:MAG: ATP-dependent 6-phosphofructokinase [Alphaproteobacteria bacterium]|nr:ATP-dependent 6-phosphofructokinase [Alphaproteobacteria bacterium]MBP3687252.1 ATP-dependent 6-phosphofructokinase [Alphaproteobacteria bacterium]
MTKIKKIGILTSGGDCAGLNAVVSSVVSSAAKYGWEVYGIHNGTDGLTEAPLSYEILTESNFVDTPWPRIAGSYLGSLNKGVKMESQAEISKRFGKGVAELGLDAVVVVGGDGSMNIVSNYCRNAGVKMVGIPKTIDNDTPLTQYSVGFNSACQVCVEAVDALWKTARSHQRALILEVMGRDAGHLAMHSAVAGFADVCLVPEIPYTIDGIINKLKSIKARGRNHAVIVVSEGVHTETGEMVSNSKNLIGEKINGGIGEYLSAAINQKYSGFQTRVTKLGHVQRAGDPTAFDRALACAFGAKAVELLKEGKTDVMVALNGDKIDTYPLEEVVAEGTTMLNKDSVYVRAAVDMGMYVGEI